MCTMEFQQMDPNDGYHTPQPGPFASGLMPPVNTSAYEGRRDSIVSLQPPLSYAHSCTSELLSQGEFSMPVTPCLQMSPIGGDSRHIDFMRRYEAKQRNEFARKPFDGFSQVAPMALAQLENIYDSSWALVPHRDDDAHQPIHGLSFQHNEILSAATDWNSAFHALVSQPLGLDQSTGITADSSERDNLSNVPITNNTIPYSQQELPTGLPMWSYSELKRGMSLGDSQGAHAFFPQTIMPMETMVNFDGEYVQSQSNSMNISLNNSFSPHDSCTSPILSSSMLASSKPVSHREVKDELGVNNNGEICERTICISRTRGKAIKEERRGKSGPKSHSRPMKVQTQIVKGIQLTTDFEIQDVCTDKNGRRHRAHGPTKPKQVCGVVLEDGRICRAAFDKSEHFKRHQDTHNPSKKTFPCIVPGCEKVFGRSDNCNAHFITHASIPGKRLGRNCKYTNISVQELLVMCNGDKGKEEKIIRGYEKEVAKLRAKKLYDGPRS
ncbi:hypothetical protein GQ43DRAFT_430729 [Delitschia confertaspora ATCC 74209]|uniref:C2H2-type domain-containing protein n=1 Tax=Delitschia confertaspora ATCC 74209 TaxID=1513339 RepID=A0A9P4MWT2_9PLEO|nr:hypothetical protein GQ43DRAFT_430729 [Delitschia confertaspora ATCC 74209]